MAPPRGSWARVSAAQSSARRPACQGIELVAIVIRPQVWHRLVRDFPHRTRTIRHPILTAVGVMVERRPPATSA